LSDIAETTGGEHQATGTECSGEVLMNPLGLRERHDNTAPGCCSMPCSSSDLRCGGLENECFANFSFSFAVACSCLIGEVKSKFPSQ